MHSGPVWYPCPTFSNVKSKRELIGKATYTHFISFELQELVKKVGF